MANINEQDLNDTRLPNLITEVILESLAPVSAPATLCARVLARVAQTAAMTGFRTLRGAECWRALAPGLEYKLLSYNERADSKSFLLRAAPGSEFPAHEHIGDEECIVLEGEFSMGDLTLYCGDYHFAPRGSHHPDAHTDKGALVYLSASLRDYPQMVPWNV